MTQRVREMSKKLIKTLNDREFYARYADYAGSDENGDRISDRKVKSVTVSGRTMTVTNTDGELEVPVVPVPTEVGLVLKSGEDGEYGWGHGEVPGDGKLKVKLGSADAADTGFSADVHSDVTLEISVATGSADGLMSATDKTELDRISAGFDEKAERTELTEAVSEIDGRMDVIESSKQDVIADLSDIRSGAAAGSTAYQKPNAGIPKDDLASDVRASLVKADTALQVHQDISGKAEKSEMAIADVSGDATKKNIQLKTGLAQDVLVAHQGITAGDGINVSRVDNVLTIAHQVEVVSLTAELVSGTDTDYAVTVPLNKYTMITVPHGAGTLTVNVPAAPEGVLQEAAFQFDVEAGEDFDFDVRTNNVQLKRIAPLSLTAGNSYQGTVIGGLCTLGEFEEVH